MAARRLIPLADRVLVKRVTAELKTASGIFLPDTNSKKNEGVVIATGPGATNRDGKVIPVNVKVGDKVLLPEYGGHTLKGDKEEELLLLRDEDILAVIQE